MSIYYVGRFVAKPGESDALKAFLETTVVPAVTASVGCESCQLLQDTEDAHQFLMIEYWESLAAHKASIKNIPPEAISQFMALVAEPPAGKHYQMLS